MLKILIVVIGVVVGAWLASVWYTDRVEIRHNDNVYPGASCSIPKNVDIDTFLATHACRDGVVYGKYGTRPLEDFWKAGS